MINIKRAIRLNRGTAQGQLAFWDATLNKWTPTETDELFWDDTNKRMGLGTINPVGNLHIGTGTFVGNFNNPAFVFGSALNGIYLDSNRFFFKAGGQFGGGMEAGRFIGNGAFMNTASGFDDLSIPKFGGERKSADGLKTGLGGNLAGDLSLITDDIVRLVVLQGGNVGIGTTNPATSAKLDISSTTGALLLPRMTTTQRDALTAVNGMLIYNSTDDKLQGYENGGWANLI